MIKVDENDPVGELEPSFPYRDVVIKRNVDMKQFYELETEIGRGKFGTVYRCREKSTGLQLAAKFVGMGRRQERRNVEREVDIMRTLQHPRLIQLYDAFEISNVMCVIQELIEGGELFERVIDDDFILTEKACTVFVRQICEAVEFIHSQHILHLDLKPENILCLTRTGNRIKIIDFGLARKFEPDKKLQVLFGTPEFVAPEVVNFDQIGFGTDMWSVGVICYVLLSGLSPFMGETDVETMANVTIAQYDFDDDAFDDISGDAKDFISKLLMKNREQRMSASECMQHSWLRRKPPPPRAQQQPPARRISGGLDSAKENLREFVDRWSQQSSSPQMIEIINAGRKGSLDRSISADKMKILNEENMKNNVENNSVTLMNSSNKQEELLSRNASTDTIKATQLDAPLSQNIVGKTSENIIPQNENLKDINKVPDNNKNTTIETTNRSNIGGIGNNKITTNEITNTGGTDVKQVVNPPSNINLKLDIEAAKNVPSSEPVKSVTSPVKTDNIGTSKVSSPVNKSGTIPKTPSGSNLKFDPTSSPKSPLGTIQSPLSSGVKKDISADKVKDVVSNIGTCGSGESISKQSENSGKPSVISQTQILSRQASPIVPQSPKQEPSSIKQQVPQVPFKPAAAISSPILEKPSFGMPVTSNQPKTIPSTSAIQSTTPLKPATPVTQNIVPPKLGSQPSSDVKPSFGIQPPSQPKPIPTSTLTTSQSKFGNLSSNDIKPSAGIQVPTQPKTIPASTFAPGAAQSKFGKLPSSDLKTSTESKPKPLEQPSVSLNVPQSEPTISSTPKNPVPSASTGTHPTFFLSSADSIEEHDVMENDSVPNELKNVVHEMRHINVHKPKMTSQLSEPDLTKCTLQRNIPDKKSGTRGVEQEASKSNIFKTQKNTAVDSRMSKPTMKHVPPKIHGIVLGQNQTTDANKDEGRLGPKVIMHKIHVEGRSEPLISRENTSKSQKPITKSQTLSKLELNETTDKVKSPSICNLVAKDRFDMRRGSDISCFLHNTENMESPSLSEEIKKLSSRLFQKGQEDNIENSVPRLIGHSAFKNDPIGRFMANHGVMTKRPKYRLSNLNRDVPLGSPPPSSNIFYHLSHSDSFSDPHTTHSAPQSPTESPERELASRHTGLTRDVILSLFGNKPIVTTSDNDDSLSATSTIDSLASYFNRANSKNISSFFNK